jgi:hypothetical protein
MREQQSDAMSELYWQLFVELSTSFHITRGYQSHEYNTHIQNDCVKVVLLEGSELSTPTHNTSAVYVSP